MTEWINAMSAVERVFAYIAIAGTFALIIQTVLLIVGLGQNDHDIDHDTDHDFDHDHDCDHDHDFDHDHDHDFDHDQTHGEHVHDDGLRLLTLRGLVAFAAIMGWSGLAMMRGGVPSFLSIAVAIVMGLGAMVLMAKAIQVMMRLETDGNMDIRNAIGRVGEVYITVPPSRTNRGKVNVVVQAQLIEVDAVTDERASILTGTSVLVLGVVDQNCLVVEPVNERKAG